LTTYNASPSVTAVKIEAMGPVASWRVFTTGSTT
jgi:hypothetical protein